MTEQIEKTGPDPDCPNCDGTGGALPGGACGICWNWRGDEVWEHHAKTKRYPGWGTEDNDGPFSFQEYAEWAASEYEGIDWPWTITHLEITKDDEHIFRVIDPKRTLIISVWLHRDDGFLHHEDQSHRADYQKYFQFQTENE